VRYKWGKVCPRILLCLSLAIPSLAIPAGRAQAQDAPDSQPPPQTGSQPTPERSPEPPKEPAQEPAQQPGNAKPEPSPEPSKHQPVKSEPSPSENPQQKDEKDEKKDEAPNPAQAAAEKTKEVTIQAAEATKNLGTAALLKARDWEGGWLTGVYVEKGRPLIPLSLQQRREIYLEQTLTTPGAYLKRMFAAGIDQARGTPREWGGGIGGYSTRFASREGQFIAANSLAALANATLKYEPRYDQCRCSGFWPRTRHAIMRNFLTYNQSEQELRPQWGLYGGSFGGGLISTAWKPHPRNAFAEGGRAMAGQAGYGVLLNIFIEFSTDLNRKIGAGKR
jgi:hypothetical protein